MKSLGSPFGAVVIGLLLVAGVAPRLIELSHAVVPVLVVLILGVALLRVVWFKTRRW